MFYSENGYVISIVWEEKKKYIHHFYFVIFTSCLDQTSFCIARPLVSRKWIPIPSRRVQKYTPPRHPPPRFSARFQIGGPTHGETNEARGTPPDFDYRR